MKMFSKKNTLLAMTALLILLIVVSYTVWRVMNNDASLQRDKVSERDVLILVWRISNYYEISGELPHELSDTKGLFGSLPGPGQSSLNIEYKKLGSHEFKICTYFNDASPLFGERGNYVRYGDPLVHGYGTWIHGKGHQCIERDVAKFSFPSYRKWKRMRKSHSKRSGDQ